MFFVFLYFKHCTIPSCINVFSFFILVFLCLILSLCLSEHPSKYVECFSKILLSLCVCCLVCLLYFLFCLYFLFVALSVCLLYVVLLSLFVVFLAFVFLSTSNWLNKVERHVQVVICSVSAFFKELNEKRFFVFV